MAASNSKVRLKLMIDRTDQRVLFAEAGKDFVDFLFSLLTLPIGTVISLLSKKGKVGCCLPNLYQSVKELDDRYMQSKLDKDLLLNPKPSLPSPHSLNIPLLPMGIWSSSPSSSFSNTGSSAFGFTSAAVFGPSSPGLSGSAFGFSSSPLFDFDTSSSFSSYKSSSPSLFGQSISPFGSFSSEKRERAGGFVKEVVTYMVMDDLVVKPMSTISSITLLNQFRVKDVGALEEKVVEISSDQGLILLKNALSSDRVLTNVFLGSVRKTD